MTKIILKEAYKITVDPMVIGDINKLVVTFDENGVQKKATIPWEEIEDEKDFIKLLKKAFKQAQEPKRVINLINAWKGEYNI